MNVMIGSQEGAAPIPPDAKVTYRMSGRVGSVPSDIDQNLAANDTWVEMMIHYAKTGALSFEGDENAVQNQDVGMIGQIEGYVGNNPNEFFVREKTLGLPKNAVFVDADSIHVVDAFTTSGRIPGHLTRADEIDMLLWGITVESDEQTGSSEEVSKVGVAGGTYANLSASAVEYFLGPNQGLQIADPDFDFDGTFPQLDGWLRFGFTNGLTPSLFAEDAELTVRTRLTVQCDVLVPRGYKTLSAP